MPELPEVETVRSGIEPHLCGQRIEQVTVRESRLRWPVAAELPGQVQGLTIDSVRRRAKYLLIETTAGSLMVHLGMSGRLYLVAADAPVQKHDHVDILLSSGKVLRYTDPRRFGSIFWLATQSEPHFLLVKLGPEPLSTDFNGDYLFRLSRQRKVPIKSFLMDGHVVVGVGNIYANEALHMAGIRPTRLAGQVSRARYQRLADCVKTVLTSAIAQGGTTLKDFVNGDGKPGYFKQELLVYGRGGLPCPACARPLEEIRLSQRATVFCKHCQR